MFQFVFCGILATIFAYFSQYKGHRQLLLLSLAIIAYIMGLQDSIAYDFADYAKNFEKIMDGTQSAAFLKFEGRHTEGYIEIGWFILNKVLGSIIHSYHFVSFVASIFMCCVIYKFLQHVDRKWHWLSILYFYFISMQFCMSGIRQALAMMCFLLVVLFYIERKWKSFVLFSIIGLSFHNSFLVILCTIPLLFVPDKFIKKHLKKIVAVCITLYAIVLLRSDAIRALLIANFLDKMQENVNEYNAYFESILETKTSLMNILFRALNFTFIIIAFLVAKEKERKLIIFFLVSTYAVAVVGENSAVARINNYFTIFSIPAICIIPSVIKKYTLRYAFVALTLVYILKSTIDRLDNYQYVGYLDFHTILF